MIKLMKLWVYNDIIVNFIKYRIIVGHLIAPLSCSTNVFILILSMEFLVAL